VMGNNPYGANPVNTPLPPTTRTGQMPHVPAMAPLPGGFDAAHHPSASPYAHSQQVVESYSGPAPMPMNAHGSSPPPGAYGPPPGGAYGPAPSLQSVPPAGRADVPTVVPPQQSRSGVIAAVVVVVALLLAAAAFGAYRMMAHRADATPPPSPVATANASPPAAAPA